MTTKKAPPRKRRPARKRPEPKPQPIRCGLYIQGPAASASLRGVSLLHWAASNNFDPVVVFHDIERFTPRFGAARDNIRRGDLPAVIMASAPAVGINIPRAARTFEGFGAALIIAPVAALQPVTGFDDFEQAVALINSGIGVTATAAHLNKSSAYINLVRIAAVDARLINYNIKSAPPAPLPIPKPAVDYCPYSSC